MAHRTDIAPLDLTPTGHVPFLVDAVRTTAEVAALLAGEPTMTHDETAADIARELEAEALKTSNPAGTLTHMREVLPELLADSVAALGLAPATAPVLRPLVDHRLNCFANVHGLFETLAPDKREPYEIMLNAVREGADPVAVGEQMLDILARARAEKTAAPCPVFRDCDVTGPHYDHSGYGALKVMDETGREVLVDAGMVALSGDGDPHATVCLGVAEYSDLAALKAKTQELRRFLDEVDQLGERVFTDHQARG